MKSPNSVFGTIAAFTIFVLLGYFIIGLGLVFIRRFEFQDFIIWLGVLGGLASAVGLLSFFLRSTTKEDLQELQLGTLREIADSSRKLESLEEARQVAQKDISSLESQRQQLEIQRQQMEVMIRKASLSIFLQEQHKLFANKIAEELQSNDNLSSNLKQLSVIQKQLDALNEEISKDENVDLLLEIIRQSQRRSDESGRQVTIDLGSPLLNSIYKIGETLLDVMRIRF